MLVMRIVSVILSALLLTMFRKLLPHRNTFRNKSHVWRQRGKRKGVIFTFFFSFFAAVILFIGPMSNRRVDLVIDQVGNKTLLNIQIKDLFLLNGGIFKLDKLNNRKLNLLFVYCIYILSIHKMDYCNYENKCIEIWLYKDNH